MHAERLVVLERRDSICFLAEARLDSTLLRVQKALNRITLISNDIGFVVLL
jgi:hypothetical protein